METDYLVIGGGAAGCVVAARLSEDPSCRVLLLEAGPGHRHPLLTVPGALPVVATTPRFNWSDVTVAEAGLNGRVQGLPQGRVLGGGTSINGMVYTRGLPSDFDSWAAAGARGWDFESVLPLFRRSENSERGASHWHGDAGPLRVTRGRSDLPVCDLFLDAAGTAGFARPDDLCEGEANGFGWYDAAVSKGRRTSAATAFLAPALRRPNLTVISGAQVLRVIVEKGRAVGAEFLRDGARRVARAMRETILCAGGIRSAQLLLLSGIGPAADLKALGVPVIHDARAVGADLQNHVAYKMQFTCRAPVTAYRYLNPARAVLAGAAYALLRRGYLAYCLTPIGGFFRAGDAGPADMQVFMNPALFGRIDRGLLDLLPKRHGFSLSVNQGRPYSRGRVSLASGDPLAPPRIAGHYFSDGRDVKLLARAIERLRDLVLGGPLAAVVEDELQPGPGIRGEAAMVEEIRRNAGNYFHVAGTCRMGEDDGAVVDSRLRVRGIDGLRVADASVMPVLVNGNTAAAVMMIGEKCAEMIRAEAA